MAVTVLTVQLKMVPGFFFGRNGMSVVHLGCCDTESHQKAHCPAMLSNIKKLFMF